MKMRKFEKGGFATSEDSEANKDPLGDFIATLDTDKPLPVSAVADGEEVVTDNIKAKTSPAAKSQNFSSAFANARAKFLDGGPSTFVWSGDGKRYSTELAKPSTSGGSGGGRGPTAAQFQNNRVEEYKKAQEAAQTPEGKARIAAMEKSQALQSVYPETALMGGAGFGIKSIAKAAQNLANRGGVKEVAKRVEPTFREAEKQLALPKPTLKLGYDKAGAKAVERGGRAEGRQTEMLKENARRSGLREDASAETLKAVRDKLGGDKFTVMKRGGSVKGYASGGTVSASSRGDGIAQRGKTKGTQIKMNKGGMAC